MLRAHWCYAAACCEHGTVALVQMATASLPRLFADREFRAMSALAAGESLSEG